MLLYIVYKLVAVCSHHYDGNKRPCNYFIMCSLNIIGRSYNYCKNYYPYNTPRQPGLAVYIKQFFSYALLVLVLSSIKLNNRFVLETGCVPSDSSTIKYTLVNNYVENPLYVLLHLFCHCFLCRCLLYSPRATAHIFCSSGGVCVRSSATRRSVSSMPEVTP